MKSAVFNYPYLPEATTPELPPVLTQPLQQELNQVLASFRKQVRNVVAVGQWWQRHKHQAGLLPPIQVSRTEELSFHLKASPEAFALFTTTLLQTNFYLHENARLDADRQVLQVRVDFSNLAAWEYELSVLFEQISPASYLQTLWQQRRPLRIATRKAS